MVVFWRDMSRMALIFNSSECEIFVLPGIAKRLYVNVGCEESAMQISGEVSVSGPKLHWDNAMSLMHLISRTIRA